MKTTVLVSLFVAAVAPLAAQTLTERLQKGIYTEEALGNSDAAIEIYRDILATTPAQHQVARHARERLDAAVARNRSPRAAAQAAPIGRRASFAGSQREPLARFANGRYRHTWSGIEFTVPAGWEVGETGPSSDHGEQVALRHAGSGVTLSVWMITESTPAEAVRSRLDGAPAEKVRQRKSGYSISGFLAETYTIPEYSVQPTWIGGRPAVLAVAEYMGVAQPWRVIQGERTVFDAAGEKRVVPTRTLRNEPEAMNEYMTWIYSENSRAFFFGRVRAEELATARQLFDEIIQSAVVP